MEAANGGGSTSLRYWRGDVMSTKNVYWIDKRTTIQVKSGAKKGNWNEKKKKKINKRPLGGGQQMQK